MINIGGGLGIPYFPGEQSLDILALSEPYGNAVDRIHSALGNVEVVTELGRFLVGEAGLYVCQVIDIKESRGSTFVVCDGGLHHHLAASGNFGQVIRKNYPVTAVRRREPAATVSVVGPLCTPLDLLGDRVELSALAPGGPRGCHAVRRLWPECQPARLSFTSRLSRAARISRLMGVRVRLADPVVDRSELVAGLHDHLNPLTDRRRYDWLYLENPDGPARIWVLDDEQTGRIVGSSALLPRKMFARGREILGCVVADTWVHPDHRVLGPALKLQRACIADIRSGTFALGYDYPRQAMPAVYQRLRLTPVDSLVAYLQLLRFNSFLSQRIGFEPAASIAAAMLNPLLRLLNRPRGAADLETGLEAGPCGDEYTAFHASVAADTICVARTAAYLNWRYHGHFHLDHEFFVARRNGAIAGYAVVAPVPPRADIIDIVCERDDAVLITLVSRLLALLTGRGFETVSCSTLQTGPTAACFERLKFRRQSQTPLIVVDSGDNQITGAGLGEFSLGQEAD